MLRDPLNRRVRTAPPSPTQRRLVLSESDYLLFEAIERHGPLPSNYLYEFTKHLRRDRTHLQNRLTDFFNGDCNGPYLTRPAQQFAAHDARYQHIVYDLASRARVSLAECRVNAVRLPARSDPFIHRLMTACVGASIERCAAECGIGFIPLSAILARDTCPAAQSRDPLQLASSDGSRSLVPDGLFGLEYPGAGFRFFAAEVDRNTESIERRNLRQSGFGQKISRYFEALRSQTYRTWWGVPNLHVLIVTTNATHGQNILDCVRRLSSGQHEERFLLSVETAFGANWKVPSSLLTNLLERPWRTANGTKEIGAV